MVYDCFIFFDELDLLEIRLCLLDSVVDYFVIVESNYTFSGNKKSYNFMASQKRFSKWKNKIVYIPLEQSVSDLIFQKNLDSYSSIDAAWTMEHQQRNALAQANYLFMDDDKILLSDLDEIPDPRIIKSTEIRKEPQTLLMMFHYYFLNCQSIGNERLWKGTILSSGKYFKSSQPQILRDSRNKYVAIEKGGWHFSYLGGIEKIKYKIQSFAHTEFNKVEHLQDEHILKSITEGEDIFNRPGTFYQFNTPFYYPWILQKIIIRYPELIFYPKKAKLLNKLFYKTLVIFYKVVK